MMTNVIPFEIPNFFFDKLLHNDIYQYAKLEGDFQKPSPSKCSQIGLQIKVKKGFLDSQQG